MLLYTLLLVMTLVSAGHWIDLDNAATRHRFTLDRNSGWRCTGGDACTPVYDANLTALTCSAQWDDNATHYQLLCRTNVHLPVRMEALSVECDLLAGTHSVLRSDQCRATYRLFQRSDGEMFLRVIWCILEPLVRFVFVLFATMCSFNGTLRMVDTFADTYGVMTLVEGSHPDLTQAEKTIILTPFFLFFCLLMFAPLVRRGKRSKKVKLEEDTPKRSAVQRSFDLIYCLPYIIACGFSKAVCYVRKHVSDILINDR